MLAPDAKVFLISRQQGILCWRSLFFFLRGSLLFGSFQVSRKLSTNFTPLYVMPLYIMQVRSLA